MILEQNKQMLTVASSDDAGGSWLWRREKLDVTREAGVREGGVGCKEIKTKQTNTHQCFY